MEPGSAVRLREEFLRFDFQHFGEIHERAVVHEDEAGFDFGDSAAVGFHPGDLEFGGKDGLGPATRIAESAYLRADVVFEQALHFAFASVFSFAVSKLTRGEASFSQSLVSSAAFASGRSALASARKSSTSW